MNPGKLFVTACLILLVTACTPRPIRGEAQAETQPPTPSARFVEADDPFQEARERLVATGVERLGVASPPVLAAMRVVPRHLFVPEAYIDQAYDNYALPIGFGQTISQPYIVGLMSEALNVEPGERVLEIGTGSGYQASVLAEMGLEVYSIEIIQALAEQAVQRLEQLGYSEVRVQNADGYYGWPDYAPFDAILVTAAPDHVPQPLLEQVKIGGMLVIPVGPVGGYQELWKIERIAEDAYESVSLGGVRFVPLTGEH